MPTLHGAKTWNAAAIAFFNPALSLDDAFAAAEGIDQLRRAVNSTAHRHNRIGKPSRRQLGKPLRRQSR